MKLCIIDNEALRQRNLRSILASLGYKSADVETFDDENLGLSNVKKKNFNACFIYMGLPKMNGIDVLKEIRSNSRLKTLPVILYSTEVTKENVVAAVQAGASGFLGYPFSVSDVESSLKQATTPKK